MVVNVCLKIMVYLVQILSPQSRPRGARITQLPQSSRGCFFLKDNSLIKKMTSTNHSHSAAGSHDDPPFSGTCLTFRLCVADPLQVEGVLALFFDFADEEDRHGTIVLDFDSVSVAHRQLQR